MGRTEGGLPGTGKTSVARRYEEIVSRDDAPWVRAHLVIDTVAQSIEQRVRMVIDVLAPPGQHLG